MIPLRDNIPNESTPFVNYALIGLNVIAFLYQLTLGDAELARFFHDFGVIPAEYWSLGRSGEPLLTGVGLPLLTSMFLHGGVMHILGNMLFLWVFGDNVEDRFGHALYLGLYLLFGLTASAAHIAFSMGSEIPTIGASGAVSGVLGAYLVFYPSARVRALLPLGFIMFYRELPALLFLGLWFGLQLVSGVMSLGIDAASSGVAWWAHIGGFVVGAAVALGWRALFQRDRPARRARQRDPNFRY
jgi:membrane associated rhomboid family serine protease